MNGYLSVASNYLFNPLNIPHFPKLFTSYVIMA